MRWRKAAILGVGLLGGSLGLALRRKGLAAEVSGFARRESSAREALEHQAVDSIHLDPAEAVRDADLVVCCTPVAQMASLVARCQNHLTPGALVTDVGSVKESVVSSLEGPVEAAGGQFIGSHPMAGSEQSGVGAARDDLFAGAVTIITPTERTRPPTVAAATQLWATLGARVLTLTPRRHDELVSRSSHLPHIAAAALAHYILDPGQHDDLAPLCATGFRDTTRVASGSPAMWRDIVLANRKALLNALEGFESTVANFRQLVQAADPQAIETFLTAAKERRDRWCDSASGTSAE